VAAWCVLCCAGRDTDARAAGLLTVYPKQTEVEWLEGKPDMISTYRFATETIDHIRCKECGSPLGIDFKGKIFEGDRIGLNVSCPHSERRARVAEMARERGWCGKEETPKMAVVERVWDQC
jgi:hypothetical protein